MFIIAELKHLPVKLRVWCKDVESGIGYMSL